MSAPPFTDDEWHRSGLLGQKIVREHVAARLLRRIDRGVSAELSTPLIEGVLTETGRLMAAMLAHNPPDVVRDVEAELIAFLRGGFRGHDYPVNEDDTPYCPVETPGG